MDKMSRWDSEWRAYRGGQNTPLIILDLTTQEETLIPNNKTTDIQPRWIGDHIYFLSDRDLVMNIWSYHTTTQELTQLTTFKGSDVKWLGGHEDQLIYERDGLLHTYDISSSSSTRLKIDVIGDFPWSATKWEDVSERVNSATISPNGKRAIMSSRGEIFTIPVKDGDVRNITQTSDAADRNPIWSPKGDRIAWFSDEGHQGYQLIIVDQDGLSNKKTLSIGESKMAWDPSWSPDGKHIAFVDDDVRMRVIHIESQNIKTIDVGNNNLERGQITLEWSPDSKWIAYSKSAANNFRQIYVWSAESSTTQAITDPFADSFSPVWDLGKKQLYFLASTDVALGSGWANTSAMQSNAEYAVYVINLDAEDDSPFKPRSDEEEVEKEEEGDKEEMAEEQDQKKKGKKKGKEKNKAEDQSDTTKEEALKVDVDGIARRILPLPMPVRNYRGLIAGPPGAVFIAESIPNERGVNLKKFTLEEQETKDFLSGVRSATVSANGKHMLARVGPGWKVIDTGGPKGENGKSLKANLQMKLDRSAEWKQMFEEAWRYERDYFYDPDLHGRDWQVVYDRYAPLVPFIKHRSDLTYILDQVNGELSVGHSFVFGGDFPDRERSVVGLLGADLMRENGRWKIERIYTTESWNPGLTGPLDAPGLNIKEGDYIVGINGKELTATDNIYEFLDGTRNKQTTLHISKSPTFSGSEKKIVKPIANENSLRTRTWVEDNRRLVDELSGGRLAYVWVPNTSGPGFVSFNRYFFAQQDKEGAVIDERYNGGGLLDDYMVDLMTRDLRASITNEVPNGKAMRLPAGILGPKVLLINELAGSGGDFFPWVFRQQKAGQLIGATTWGGLVKSSVHYGLVDGGALTAPDNAVFDPVKNEWIGENKGIAPDIAVRQDAVSLSAGRDPQLERGVAELMKLLGSNEEVIPPTYSAPAKGN